MCVKFTIRPPGMRWLLGVFETGLFPGVSYYHSWCVVIIALSLNSVNDKGMSICCYNYSRHRLICFREVGDLETVERLTRLNKRFATIEDVKRGRRELERVQIYFVEYLEAPRVRASLVGLCAGLSKTCSQKCRIECLSFQSIMIRGGWDRPVSLRYLED